MAAAVAFGLVMLPCAARTQDAVGDSLRVTGADVSVLCPLTIGGSFEAKTKAISGEVTVPSVIRTASTGGTSALGPHSIDDYVLVDLKTLQTGIGLRDNHMKNKYLEVERGPDFSHARLANLRLERLDGKTTFQGVLTLHGQTKPVTGTADIKPEGDGYRVTASFPVRVSEFGIPEPSYLGVGVKDEVIVRVRMRAVPTSPPPTLAERGGTPGAVGTSGKAAK
jgi:hypothetical protein